MERTVEDFCSKRVCIDNEKTRFSNDEEYSIFCPKCRSIEFNVIEDVQLCVKGSDIRFRKGSYRQSCGITVDVDGRRVLHGIIGLHGPVIMMTRTPNQI